MRMETTTEEFGGLFGAMALVQGDLLPAKKDVTGQVGQQKTKYADLASCWDACRAALAKHGVCVVQIPSADGSKVTVKTILGHKSGQRLSGELTMVAMGSDPQKVGSAITYARRYGLCAMVGIAPEDDDGAAASERPPQQRSDTRSAPRPAAVPKAQESVKTAPAIDAVSDQVEAMWTEMSKGKDESLRVFANLHERIVEVVGRESGDRMFYGVLGKHGAEHADEFKTRGPAKLAARELLDMFNSLSQVPEGFHEPAA